MAPTYPGLVFFFDISTTSLTSGKILKLFATSAGLVSFFFPRFHDLPDIRKNTLKKLGIILQERTYQKSVAVLPKRGK